MIKYSDPRMSPYRILRTATIEFVNLDEGGKEDIREFSRRVRLLGESANATMNGITRDNINREQFNNGLFDLEIEELLLREDPNTFNDAVDKALNIDAISRGSRTRQRRRLATTRYLQHSDQCVDIHHVQSVSGQLEADMITAEMNEMKKTSEEPGRHDQKDVMMSKFVNSVITGPPKETTGDQDGNPR